MSMLAKCMAWISIAVAVGAIVGWALDLDLLLRPVPAWARMKLATAVNLLACGVIVLSIDWHINHRGGGTWPVVVCAALGMFVMGCMALLLIEGLTGGQIAAQRFFLEYESATLLTVVPRYYSLSTIICFSMFGFLGATLLMVDRAYYRAYASITALVIALLAAGSFAGHYLEKDWMMLAAPGVSLPMARYTSVAFLILAVATVAIWKEAPRNEL